MRRREGRLGRDMVEAPTTVLVIGYYGAGNLGDEAVLAALVGGVRAVCPDVRLIVPGENPRQLASRHEVESFAPWDMERLADALDQADAVLVGGGGLLHDYVFHDPQLMFSSRHWGLPFYCGIPWLASELGKPVMLYAVGVGPLEFAESRDMVRDLASAAAAITVRDCESLEALAELGVRRTGIEVTADPVWALSPGEGPDLDRILEVEGIKDGRWLAVVVRNWPFAGEQEIWERELIEGVGRVARARDLGVLFVPFQHSPYPLQDDAALAQRLAATDAGFVAKVAQADGYTPKGIAGLLGACDAVVAMRFHALVFAAMTGTPAVALAYDPKVSHLASLMAPTVPCLRLESLASGELAEALEIVLGTDPAALEAMMRVAAEQRKASLRNAEVAGDLIRNRPTAHRSLAGERTLRLLREAARLRGQRLEHGAPEPKVLQQQVVAPPGRISRLGSRRVRLLAPAFFDFEGETMLAGGAERYLLELADLVREMGCDVEVLQTAAEHDWERTYGDLVVQGVAAGSSPAKLAEVVDRRGLEAAALTIFLAFNQAHGVRFDNAIGISHGVYWDDPIYHGEKGANPALTSSILSAFANLDTVVSVDANTINWVRATRADLAERFVHIPNFVDLSEFHPAKVEIADHSGVEVLFPRRLSAVRGFWLLTEILPRLLDEHPEVRVNLVGQATESWEREAILRARDHLLGQFAGRVRCNALPPEEMPEAYRTADIVVIPTMASEGTSLACLEAQACGCAVVATPVGGLPEIIVDGFSGFLVDPVPEAVHSVLDRLIRDQGLRERLGSNAAEAAKAFSIEHWRRRWRRVLQAHVALDQMVELESTMATGVGRGGSMGGGKPTTDTKADAASEKLAALRDELRDRDAWLTRVRRRLAEERARAQVLLEEVQREVWSDFEERSTRMREEHAEEINNLERLRKETDQRADGLRQDLAEQGALLGAVRTEAEELHTARDELLRQVEELKHRAAGLEHKVAKLEEENRALAWEARGVVGRAIDRIWRPRPEGRLTYWLRRFYYAVAGVLLRLLGKRRGTGGNDSPLMDLYEYRFWRFKRDREKQLGVATLSDMRCPTESRLVSVVLPVYNGAAVVGEAIESVLSQDYEPVELIVVDDGSTDATPQIVDDWAARDSRVRVIHQENQQLPRALSTGFRHARGEFLTWTSDDNRFKAGFLEKMVACLGRNLGCEMVYANQDIIGDDGSFLHESEWFSGYQGPPGSPHIYLPENTGVLNIWPNNYVGAAFIYRDRVPSLLGDFSSHRFTIEDYDYWMLVNDFLCLKHVDFDDQVYDYRFHGKSLTAREGDLNILALREELMVFDDFRRDFALSPIVWLFSDSSISEDGQRLLEALRARAKSAGHLIGLPEGCDAAILPRLWLPAVHVAWTDDPNDIPDVPGDLPPGCTNVLLTGSGDLPDIVSRGWDFCATSSSTADLPLLEEPYQGWYGLPTPSAVFEAAEIRTRTRHLRAIEDEAFGPSSSQLEASVIVCTYRRTECLETCLRSLANQTLAHDRYEILLVNNHPGNDLSDLVESLRAELFADRPDGLRTIMCPLKGLSFARNAGIGEARGEVVCFIDDDAVADGDWLEKTLAAFREDPEAGVVGGHILLVPPEPAPRWLRPDMWGLWSHFQPNFLKTTEVNHWWEFPWGANWSARRAALLKIGGFRCGYGRKGDDFGGGEEVVAAELIRRIGWKVAIQPESIVHHHVDPARFTRKDQRKTMRSGAVVNYRMQRDLYVPKWLGPKQQMGRVLHKGWQVFFPRQGVRRREAWYGMRAEATCLRVMLGDYWERLRAT